jgi:hypothetical protein
MLRKIMIVILALVWITSPSIHAQVNKNVEVFDICQGKVINTVPTNPSFQQSAENYIKGIESIYVKVSPIPNKGYMVKIPLEPNIQIKNKWMDDFVDEVIIVFGKDEKPFLMTFDSENNIHIFTFNGDTDSLLKTFNINLNDL